MRRSAVRRFPALLVVCAALAAVFWSDLRGGEDLLIQRRYREAAAAIAAALPDLPASERARGGFLLGHAHLLAGEHAEAIAAFQAVQREHGGSAHAIQARFLEAKACERRGDLRTAAQIYREQVERLVGPHRKEEVAATYLGMAQQALAKDPPQREQAVTFFDLAVELGLPEARDRQVRLQAAEALLAAGKHQEAIGRLAPLVGQLDVASGRLRAMLALGRAFRGAGDNSRARTTLRDLRALAPKAAEAGDAADEIALAYGVPSPSGSELELAVAALHELAAGHPEHPRAKVAGFLVATCYVNCNRHDDALAAIAQFLQQHGDDGIAEVAAARALVGDVYVRQRKFPEAIAAYRDYLRLHPSDRGWERVQRAVVDAEYAIAEAAYAEGPARFAVARERWLAFAEAHPLDERNPAILYLLGDMLEREKKHDAAREAFGRCVSKYPGKEPSSHAQFRIGEILEQHGNRYEEAQQAYRAVKGEWEGTAKNALSRLVQKHLGVRTPRVFRTDEKPAFSLTSRNVEKVRVRVYRLDLEDYFRATHTAGDIGRLDIEVIAADRTFDSAVPDYVKCRETSRDVEIGFQQPGAYVVKVDDQELEATTMVLVSDLAIVARSSRHESLVFAQNTREQRAEPGVRIVLSDRKKIVGEGVTGADGVFRWRGEALQSAADLAVFAVAPGGSGASTLDLQGLGFSPGLSPKGYLYTDRPLYQPGQRVFGKGLVREVVDGIYRLPAATDYRLRLWTPGGRLVLDRDLSFSTFGGFGFEHDLAADAELGQWRIAVERAGSPGTVFHGSFAVQRYERPRLLIELLLDQPVVARGEPVAGRAIVRHFYGEPAAGKPVEIRLQLPGGAVAQHAGATNAAGELPFSFPSAEFGEEGFAALVASVAGENATAGVRVPIVTTELTVDVRTVQPVYLAGETFGIEVTVRDRSGKPLAREAAAVLLHLGKQNEARDGIAEVEVARAAVRTGADGSGRTTFQAANGGLYAIRVEVVDRFGNHVTGQAGVTISGDDDEQKLRFLAERDNYRVGETASVKVMNRAGDKLALLTWQGDGILAYEVRRLPAGESMLALPMQSMHAPNFALCAAMVDGDRLHTAVREFRVARDLQLSLAIPAVARPGSEVEVVVVAKDTEGRPVSAEVSLALVDEALLALAGTTTPRIGEFFHGELRDTRFAIASSCTWSYQGPARRVSEALLAEERRLLRESVNEAFDGGTGQPITDGRGDPQGRLIAGAGQAPRRNAAQHLASDGSQLQRDQVLLVVQEAQQAQQVQQGDQRGQEGLQQLHRFVGNDANVAYARGFLGGFDVFGVGQSQLAAGGIALPRIPMAFAEPRREFGETGAWLSAVVTDGAGRAIVKIVVPQATTTWRLLGCAATVDTQVGQAEATLKTQQELQVDLVGPPALTEGDQVVVRLASHNLTDAAVEAGLEWQATGAATGEGRLTQPLAARGEASSDLPLAAAGSGEIVLRVAGAADGHRDDVQRTIPVRPFGVEMRAGRSGSTNDRAAFELSLPEGREYAGLQLVVEVGPDPGRDLVGAALGTGFQPLSCRNVAITSFARSSQGLAALAVLEHLERTGGAAKTDLARLRALAEAAVAAVAAQQMPDGSFAWIGKQASDLRSTCQAVRLLAAANRRGIAGAARALEGAAEALLQALRTAPTEVRADLVYALAAADRVRFESLNSLQRARVGLSVDGLSRLALAWQLGKRPESAGEVLDTLREKLAAQTFRQHPVVTIALAAQALLAADRRDPLGTAALAYLQEVRIGAGWDTPEATAAALQVAVLATRTGAGAPQATKVDVRCNGTALALASPAGDLPLRFAVPATAVQARGNRVEIAVEGGGEAFYRGNLVGFGRGFLPADRRDERVRIDRAYLAAARRHDGREVPAGFSVVAGKGFERFENRVTTLRAGESCIVRTRLDVPTADAARAIAPFVVEEPIPAGCSVVRESISGSFDHVDVQPDRLVFYFREGVASTTVRYELQARFAGDFRALPTFVQSALRPEVFAYGEPGRLRVQPRGEGEPDPYRLTPDEHFHLGSAWFGKAEGLVGEPRKAALETAHGHLRQLLDGWHRQEHMLRDETFREVCRMMLFVSIERSDARSVVRFFEELKDRYPDLVIPFDKIVAVGCSYLDLGEFEAALLVFRATAEASFLKDAAVATTLEKHGEVRAAAEFLDSLLRVHPDLGTMRTSRYSIGQRLAAVAAGLAKDQPIDPRVGTAGQLRLRALQVLREFLVLYPDDFLAEEVSFAWATTHVENQDLPAALAVSQAALQRYPGSTFTDEFLYTQGYAQFVTGQHDPAFASLRRVAEEQFPLPNGGTGPSESQWHAVYLQGQIHHARGEPALALQAYEKVADRFADAADAAGFFKLKLLQLPEVATFGLAEVPQLQISYRNVEKVAVQVFRVDLLRLYLMERSLQDIRGIQLHGIKPQLSFDVALGEGRDYRTIDKKVPLQLVEPGAYLVVVRGGDQLATGMVLRSDLRLEVQEQLDVGRIRVNCRQGDAVVADAVVRVGGSGENRFRSGASDLRGVFVGDDLVGASTVVVKKGEQYAFHRGTGVHQPDRMPAPQPTQKGAPANKQRSQAGKEAQSFDAFDNNLNLNTGNRARQAEWFQQNVADKKQKGVEVGRTK